MIKDKKKEKKVESKIIKDNSSRRKHDLIPYLSYHSDFLERLFNSIFIVSYSDLLEYLFRERYETNIRNKKKN